MKRIRIEIDVKWGSEFQETTGEEALQLMLESWKIFYSQSHRNNEITLLPIVS